MSNWQSSGGFSLQRPGNAVLGVMGALFFVWLMFAVAINWGGASQELFLLFCGDSERLLHGEVWRLFTAPWMHMPSGSVGHILWALVGLFFLTPELERRWGTRRLLRFLFLSGIIAYGFQFVMGLMLQGTSLARLAPPIWFGAFPIIEAVAVAWALSFRDRQVRLMFVLPASANMLLYFVLGMSVLKVIADAQSPEGLLSPFGGMFAGWLLGASTPSPLRRAYLSLKLHKVEAQARRERRNRNGGDEKRSRGSHLRAIPGGKRDAESMPERGRKGPNGRWLN